MSTTPAKSTIEPSVGLVPLGNQGIALTSFNDLVRFGEYLIQSGFVPSTLNTVPKAVIAIQTGMEIGLTPMASLSSIYVVNGRATIWGDALPALAEARGGMVDMDEFFEFNGVKMKDPPAVPKTGHKAVCEVTLRSGRVVRRVFEWDMAVYAGLDKKDGPWRSYPTRMLQMRARALAIRDACPGALRGMPIKEEYEALGEGPTRTVEDLLPAKGTVVEQSTALNAPENAEISATPMAVAAAGEPAMSAYERSVKAREERAAKKAAKKMAVPAPAPEPTVQSTEDGITTTSSPAFALDPSPVDREPQDAEFTIL